MAWAVSNPTHRDKAVRAYGGLVIVRRGASMDVAADVAAEWSENDLSRYRAAGLEIAEAESDERAAYIAEVIREMPRDADHFTKAGKPEVDAINAALPEGMEPVTAAERDAIWKKVQE